MMTCHPTSTENVQNAHSRPKLWGFEKRCGKIGQNALTGTLIKQLPWAQIKLKFKTLCAHQKANDKMRDWKYLKGIASDPFNYINYILRLAQAENKCKQMGCWQSIEF